MKKVLYAIMLVFSVFFITACQTQQITGPPVVQEEDPVITFERYGAFSPQDMARQVMIIDSQKITYTTYSYEDEVTGSFEKPIAQAQYDDLVSTFRNNGFLQFEDTYAPDLLITDVGVGKITYKTSNITKSVVIEPYVNEGLPQSVINILNAIEQIQSTVYDLSDEQLQEIAEGWIANAPTYRYDGSSLKFQEALSLESYPPRYTVVYAFTSSHGGYGDRSGQMVTQAITEHEIRLGIVRGKVVSAVIDGRWDEFDQRMISDASIQFQPLQCVDTPWQEWYKNGSIVFVKAPTEAELATAYYNAEYGIEMRDFRQVDERSVAVSAVCGNARSYIFIASVSPSDIESMMFLGWEDVLDDVASSGNMTDNSTRIAPCRLWELDGNITCARFQPGPEWTDYEQANAMGIDYSCYVDENGECQLAQ